MINSNVSLEFVKENFGLHMIAIKNSWGCSHKSDVSSRLDRGLGHGLCGWWSFFSTWHSWSSRISSFSWCARACSSAHRRLRVSSSSFFSWPHWSAIEGSLHSLCNLLLRSKVWDIWGCCCCDSCGSSGNGCWHDRVIPGLLQSSKVLAMQLFCKGHRLVADKSKMSEIII